MCLSVVGSYKGLIKGGVLMIENDTLVRHKILGYEGLVDG